MHLADALVSAPVAAVFATTAVGLVAVAVRKVSHARRPDSIALTGVLGAFIFAAQMINFSIPGTGSSGHIIGGVLLAAVLGPWTAFLTLCSVLIVQCLVFADGGLMVLGCNIINMAAMSCLIAYPLIYKPITRGGKHILSASVLSCTVALELGALLVVLQTKASGITALPFDKFLLVMLPIHLIIGVCEGVATGLVLQLINNYDPSLLQKPTRQLGQSGKKTVAWIGVATLLLAGTFSWIASDNPDGLEWSIEKLTGSTELGPATPPPTALLPEYDSHAAGIVGALLTLLVVWAVSRLLFKRFRHNTTQG